MPLVNSGDALDAAGDMVQDPVANVRRKAHASERSYSGAAEVMEAPGRRLVGLCKQAVQLRFCRVEASDRLAFSLTSKDKWIAFDLGHRLDDRSHWFG